MRVGKSVNVIKIHNDVLKEIDINYSAPIQPCMMGTWLTHDWKKIKNWAIEDNIAKLYIPENFGCKETLLAVNSLFGNVLCLIFYMVRTQKKEIRK